MIDRIPTKPGRVELTKDDGTVEYAVMKRADEPTQEGTPLNKATLLSDETAALYGLEPETAVPDDVLELLGDSPFSVGDVRYTYRSTLGPRWALCNGAAFPADEYPSLAARFPKDYFTATSWPVRPNTDISTEYGIHSDATGYWTIVKEGSSFYPYRSDDGRTWIRCPVVNVLGSGFTIGYCNGLYVTAEIKTSGGSPYGVRLQYTDDLTKGVWTEIQPYFGTSSSSISFICGMGGHFYVLYGNNSYHVLYSGTSLNNLTQARSDKHMDYDEVRTVHITKDGSLFYSVRLGSMSTRTLIYGKNKTFEKYSPITYCIFSRVIDGPNDTVCIYYSNNETGKTYCVQVLLPALTLTGSIQRDSATAFVPEFYYNGYYVYLGFSGKSHRSLEWTCDGEHETSELGKTYSLDGIVFSSSGYPTLYYNTSLNSVYKGYVVCDNYLPTASTGNKGMNAFIKVKDGE